MAERKVEYTQVRIDGTTVTKNITDINPAADDATVATFVGAVSGLSNNTLTSITDVWSEDMTTVTPSKGPYTLDGAANSYIFNTPVSIVSAVANNTITTNADNSSIRADASDHVIFCNGDNSRVSLPNNSFNSTVNVNGDNAKVRVYSTSLIIVNGDRDSIDIYEKDNYPTVIARGNYDDINIAINSSGENYVLVKDEGNFSIISCSNPNDTIFGFGTNSTIRAAETFVDITGATNTTLLFPGVPSYTPSAIFGFNQANDRVGMYLAQSKLNHLEFEKQGNDLLVKRVLNSENSIKASYLLKNVSSGTVRYLQYNAELDDLEELLYTIPDD